MKYRNASYREFEAHTISASAHLVPACSERDTTHQQGAGARGRRSAVRPAVGTAIAVLMASSTASA